MTARFFSRFWNIPSKGEKCKIAAAVGYNQTMRFMASLVCVVLLFLTAVPLGAQEQQWFEARSDHFLLFTDTSAAKGRQLLTDLESRVSTLQSALGAIPQRQFPIEVFLFKKAEDFQEAAPMPTAPAGNTPPGGITARGGNTPLGGNAARDGNTPRGGNIDKSAYLLRGPDRIFVVARDKSPADISNDVGHALGHVLFERMVMWRPFWLAEGAAELFRKVGRDPDTKRIPADGFSVADLLKIVPSGTYEDQEPGGTFRLQAHRLFRLVIEEHSASLRDYLSKLRSEEGAQAKLALDNEADSTARLNAYVETRIAPGSVNSEIRVEPAESGNVAIHRGDVLLATNKTAAASSWYKANSNQARAARAILTTVSRATDESTRTLERTAGELPDFALVQYHFGRIELKACANQNQVAALERAVKLMPLMGRAYAELGRVYAQCNKADAALPALDRAVELEP